MRSPTVSGAGGYSGLCIAAKNEEKGQEELARRLNTSCQPRARARNILQLVNQNTQRSQVSSSQPGPGPRPVTLIGSVIHAEILAIWHGTAGLALLRVKVKPEQNEGHRCDLTPTWRTPCQKSEK